MIPKYLSAICAAIPASLGNHLWQSTLFLAVAALLTLVLRKNQARIRYGVWLAASIKFLIPFSLLIGVGSHLATPHTQAEMQNGLYVAVAEISQPFAKPGASQRAAIAHPRGASSLPQLFPPILLAVWVCGFLAVLLMWYARWRRVSKAKREAVLLHEGREVEAFRRLQGIAGIGKRIAILVSRAHMEPGIFGVARPVLIWPDGVSDRLDDAHLDAIIAHEVWHVRRQDNLAAILHMGVEAVFWFHPLVWWLGSRLLEERERSCDEAVLEWGIDRQVYAESILKTCEFCVGSPLNCWSGVAGANLKKRIKGIMNERAARRLDFSRTLLLSSFGLLALAGPVIFGFVNAPPIGIQSQETNGAPLPFFEAASVKQSRSGTNGEWLTLTLQKNRFSARNVTTKSLIEFAYNVKDYQLSGGPSWVGSNRYNIEAKVEDSVADDAKKLTPDQQQAQLRFRVQSLLADRFQLRLSEETEGVPVYALVVAENGPKLQRAKPGDTYPDGIMRPDGLPAGPRTGAGQRGQLTVQALPMASVARLLSMQLGCRTDTILDKTGLTGAYDFTLQWTPDESRPPNCGEQGTDNAPPTTLAPSISTAIEEQLGLRLELQEVPTQHLVIDSVEEPWQN